MSAAIAVADEDGLAAVSIRRLATALGARAMSLYTYIARKQDLLDLMSDEIAGEVVIAEPLPADWRDAVRTIAHRERSIVLRHPWIVDLVSNQPRIGPNALRHVEQSLSALAGLRLDPHQASRILAAVDDYVHGYVIREVRELRAPHRDGSSDMERQSLMQPYFQQLLDSGDFPNLAPLLEQGMPSHEDNFDRGLNWLLDGIAKDLAEN